MSPLRMVYLALAVIGAAIPVASLVAVFLARADEAYRDAYYLVAHPDWGGLIAAIALTVWIVAETTARRNWSALWAIPATIFIGLSCGLPLYLFLRTRPVI